MAAELLSWEDIRLASAIGVHGSLSAAAAALGVNPSTVARRLGVIEAALNVALFDRRRTGYVPTAAGEDIIALGERIDKDVLGVSRRVSARQLGHAGELKITTSDILGHDFLAPIVGEFQRDNPQIRFQITVGNEHANLSRAEADIAFRATSSPPENLFGRKIARIAWAVYGARSRYRGEGALADLVHENWVSYHGNLKRLRAWEIVEKDVAAENIGLRVDSVLGAIAALSVGRGVGYLPCMHGDLVPDLVRVSPVDPRPHDDLWLLTHPDIRRSDRVYAFMSHCTDAVAKHRSFIEGDGEYRR